MTWIVRSSIWENGYNPIIPYIQNSLSRFRYWQVAWACYLFQCKLPNDVYLHVISLIFAEIYSIWSLHFLNRRCSKFNWILIEIAIMRSLYFRNKQKLHERLLKFLNQSPHILPRKIKITSIYICSFENRIYTVSRRIVENEIEIASFLHQQLYEKLSFIRKKKTITKIKIYYTLRICKINAITRSATIWFINHPSNPLFFFFSFSSHVYFSFSYINILALREVVFILYMCAHRLVKSCHFLWKN